MSPRVIFPFSYNDTSDDKVDVALTKLECHRDVYWRPMADFESKRCQPFGSHHESPIVAIRVSNEDPSLLAIAAQGQLLKKAEQFEYDYDNNNYSNYIEDVSVHAMTDSASFYFNG